MRNLGDEHLEYSNTLLSFSEVLENLGKINEAKK
jgi:hypothetical protein